MTNAFFDYLKCVKANKFTLAGYLSTATSLGIAFGATQNETHFLDLAPLCVSSMIFGMGALKLTGFGEETLEVYRRSLKHLEKSKTYIEENGNDNSFKEKLKPWYCRRVGYNLAAKESGLEHLCY